MENDGSSSGLSSSPLGIEDSDVNSPEIPYNPVVRLNRSQDSQDSSLEPSSGELIPEHQTSAMRSGGLSQQQTSGRISKACRQLNFHPSITPQATVSRNQMNIQSGSENTQTFTDRSLGAVRSEPRTASSLRQSSVDLMQLRLNEILSEVKETKVTMDEKMKSIEDRLIKLEEIQTSSPEETSVTPKRKVPTRIRVCM